MKQPRSAPWIGTVLISKADENIDEPISSRLRQLLSDPPSESQVLNQISSPALQGKGAQRAAFYTFSGLAS